MTESPSRMMLTEPRGPLTRQLFRALRTDDVDALPPTPRGVRDIVADDDVQLALWTCFELHYRGFGDVDESWEWQPELIAFRNGMVEGMLTQVRRDVAVPTDTGTVAERLGRLVAADTGRSVARFVQREADRRQLAEYAVHRSVYQLKEADPHSWGIPRLDGRAKAALMEIQADEYGNGQVERMHTELFRTTLRGIGLDDAYGRYVNAVPGITLAVSNLISILGLHRRLRGALLGHLAVFEMSSSTPSRQVSQGLDRLGFDTRTRAFYDEHVTADALHEQLATHDMCGGLVAAEPDLADDVLFGAAACLYLDGRFAEHVLCCWADGTTSLRDDTVLEGIEPALVP